MSPEVVAPSPPVPTRPRNTRSTVCTQCKRQKQKCDRQTPCNNCIRRHIPEHCHLPGKSPTEPRDSPRQVHTQAQRPSVVHHQHPAASLAAPIVQTATDCQPASATQPVTPSRTTVATPVSGASNGRDVTMGRHPTGSASSSSNIGNLWNSRGAASYHGTSYFGHQSAASMMHINPPDLPTGMPGISPSNFSLSSQNRVLDSYTHHEKGPYAHIWELVGCLPRRKTVVDRLVKKFMNELNPVYDAVHEETFMNSYNAFYDRKWGDDDLTAVDLRWLSLLFIVLSFSALLDTPLPATSESLSLTLDQSTQFFWAARKAIVLAPTFSGESPDLVRAGILVSRYLILFGRKTEAWLTSSFAVRMAQAQGMHVDGEGWGLPRKVSETRRRLWCMLYSQDRSISLAVGRPYTINDKHCMKMQITNIWLEDDQDSEPQPIEDPTPSLYYGYQQSLASILGVTHDECFSLSPLSTSHNSYEKVLAIDRELQAWADSLPPYFSLIQSDTSLDATRPFLAWQRTFLHSAYHFARITLHRTYVVVESITDRFQYSRDACISSACADLKMKLGMRGLSMAERLASGAAMYNLFNSGLVLGMIAVKDPFSPRTNAIVEDLAAYCEKVRGDPWGNEFVLAEVKVIELCIASARKARNRGSDPTQSGGSGNNSGNGNGGSGSNNGGNWSGGDGTDLNDLSNMVVDDNWLDNWFGPTRNFPEPVDFQFWEDLVETLEVRH